MEGCDLGNNEALGNWNYTDAPKWLKLLWRLGIGSKFKNKKNLYSINTGFRREKGEIIAVEYGENRLAFPNQDAEVLQVHADHYFRFNA